jgi:hypothetical protein
VRDAVDPQKADVPIRHVLDMFNSTGLTAQQAKSHHTSPALNVAAY